MAQKAIILNTPKKPLQSDAQDWASIFSSIIGEDSGVLNYGNKLEVTKKNNNAVTVKDGVYSMQGHMIKVDKGSTIELAVDSGTLGVNRFDSVIVEYNKNVNPLNDDTFVIKILKGSPKPSGGVAAVPPTLIKNDLLQGGLKRQEVICNLKIEGTTMTVLNDRLYVNGIKGLEDKVNQDLINIQTDYDGKFTESNLYPQSGGNSNGSWVKFADGRLEQEGYVDYVVNITTPWGALFVDAVAKSITFPIPFKETPHYLDKKATSKSVNSLFSVDYSEPTVTKFGFSGGANATRAVSATSVPMRLQWRAIGKW